MEPKNIVISVTVNGNSFTLNTLSHPDRIAETEMELTQSLFNKAADIARRVATSFYNQSEVCNPGGEERQTLLVANFGEKAEEEKLKELFQGRVGIGVPIPATRPLPLSNPIDEIPMPPLTPALPSVPLDVIVETEGPSKTNIPEAEPGTKTESITKELPKTFPAPTVKGLKGFIFTQCPDCKEYSSFFLKTIKDHYHCRSCRGTYPIKLGEFKKAYLHCECGNKLVYETNATENAIDVPCQRCRAPVAIEYNSKRRVYDTIR